MATTDGTIDYVEFQAMVGAWLLAEAVLPRVYWAEEQRKSTVPYKQFGVLNIISDNDAGVDETRYGDHPTPTPGAELQQVVAGNRLVTVSVRVESQRDQRPDKTARYFLSRARTSLRDPQVRALYFEPFEIAVVRMEQLQNLDFTDERRRVSLAQMDVTFLTVVNRITDETFIERAEISSDFKDPGGASLPAALQMDDFDIGP